MEESTNSLTNLEIRNISLLLGLVAGVLGILYFFSLYFTDVFLFDISFRLDFWITIPMIIVGLVYIRRSQGSLRAWQGFLSGFYIVAACASLTALFYYVFLSFIDVDFLAESWNVKLETIDRVRNEIDNPKRVEELNVIYENTLKASKESIPLDLVWDKSFWHYLVGIIITFFSSILLRK